MRDRATIQALILDTERNCEIANEEQDWIMVHHWTMTRGWLLEQLKILDFIPQPYFRDQMEDDLPY